MTKKSEFSRYDGNSIDVVEGLAHVRQRPGMYIGSTGSRGLHHLVWEIVDNAIDEATNGYATEISVTMRKDGSISVLDDGRGIPVEINKKKKIPAVRLVFEVLGAGGKFNNKNYKTSGGLHGVGASVVNALSKWLEVTVYRDNKEYHLRYENTRLKNGVQEVGPCKRQGTMISFLPDESIFETIEFKYETLRNRLKELAFLNKGVKIQLADEVKNKKEVFQYGGGIVQFVEHINEGKTIINPNVVYLSGEKDDVGIELAMQYTTGFSENIYSFVNNIPTTEGGKHDEGFRAAVTRALNEFVKQQNAEKKRGKKDISLQGSDTTEGLTAILSVKMAHIEFDGQTKARLGNPEVKGIVYNIVYEGLLAFLKENKKAAKLILDRIMSAYDSREAAKAARDIVRKKNKLNATSVLVVGKLANCSSKDPDECELFIVEGDSAGGSAKQGRNRRTQAVLPLKGKPLNVEKKKIKDVLENEELSSLIRAINAGFANEFVLENRRYGKVIIATDADVDGSHIRLILITFFYRYMRPLIEEGHLYIAQPPLYKISNETKSEYAYSDKELEKTKSKMGKGCVVQRYKGLGEMNPDQLYDTTMDQNNRMLIRITAEEAAMADTLLSIAMGSRVDVRREYLEQNM